ncbi:DUF2333 family protein [Pseudohoeflea coraliihabitans]|uniref:DUF2333 family protein n=1 Tax=Pseudohoeflea coraliihabitans TaxID=2860393 RepID=A0ABS6WJM7_9HYPH|nr:DUF2333 family protein [Pseudohoeflea sp. DP4N28-3]MBW3096148.1 DUF2333 family protein [Pseudohoeflea sp. DP4N28-3]
MLDPIIAFFERVFHAIGRGIGWVVAVLAWPFVALGRWYRRRGWMVRLPVLVLLAALVVGYGHFLFVAERWTGWDPDYPASYAFAERPASPGEPVTGDSGQCASSAIVEVTHDLIDFNVNVNTWVPSHPLSKAGLFGLDWKYTPFLDNKAAFQLGINQVVRRTTVELVDRLGRVRGTSQINQNLQDARQATSYDEDAWWLTFTPPFIQPSTPERQRQAMRALAGFNAELAACQGDFDARADNLLQFLDRISGDIGSTSDILRAQMEASDLGWFDPRADDRFWFTYGQLYAYYGILQATQSDFREVYDDRRIVSVWDRANRQLRSALDMTPAIVSNGNEASWIMPSHLATMGFYLLRVRSNLVEMRDILDR